MGVGFALTEEFLQVDGQIKTRHSPQYQIPTIRDMPAELINRNVEMRDPTGPLGATGLGETPTLAHRAGDIECHSRCRRRLDR